MTTTEQTDYKVAGISLAEFGEKEFRVAEQEMPSLMAAISGGTETLRVLCR